MGHSKYYIRDIVDDYCVIDLETTGLSFTYDEIIEIGILKVRNNEIIDQYNQLINPGYSLPYYITEITGITDEMVKNKPKIDEVKNDILNFIDNDILVGHNTSFDLNFIKYNINKELTNNYIDTLQFCRKLYPQLKHHRLTDMSNFLKLSNNEHRALSDCLTTKQLYDEIKSTMKEKGLKISDIFANTKNRIDVTKIEAQNIEFNEDNFFFNKHCVFTGTLDKMIRREAMQLIVNIGGILDKSVTKETNYLILGNNDYCASIKNGKSNKQKKAEKLKSQGCDIEIIDENTFYELINQ